MLKWGMAGRAEALALIPKKQQRVPNSQTSASSKGARKAKGHYKRMALFPLFKGFMSLPLAGRGPFGKMQRDKEKILKTGSIF